MSFFVKIDVNIPVMLTGKHNFSTKKEGLYREFHWHEFKEIEDMYLKGVDHAMTWQENTLRNSIWGWFLFVNALLIPTWKLMHKFIAISVNKICVLMLNIMLIRLAHMTGLYMWKHNRTIPQPLLLQKEIPLQCQQKWRQLLTSKPSFCCFLFSTFLRNFSVVKL